MQRTFDRLSALDSFFLDIEGEDAPMHIGAVCLFEDPQPGNRRVTLRRLRAHVEERLSFIPRYRQRLERVPLEGHPVWVDSADFRIADHVRAIALPEPASHGHLEETVSWIFSQPLSRNRPLWEIWMIEGLPGDGFALVCKTHHCLADGLGGAALLCAILATDPFPAPEPAQEWNPRPAPNATQLVAAAIDDRVRGISTLAAGAVQSLLFEPSRVMRGASDLASALRGVADAAWNPPTTTDFDHPTGTDRRFLWWSIGLDDVKRIGRRLGGTVNDVALALVSEAFAQSSASALPGRSLRVYCPVGAGAAGVSAARLGNHLSGMFIDLPVEAPDAASRWSRVVAAARACKASGSSQGTFLLESIADTLSPSLLSRLEAMVGEKQVFNLILTNVPGPTVPLYLFEQKLTSVCPLVPLFRGQGLGIAIFSYDGTLTWGFHVDANCVDAARRLRSALAAAAIRYARLADTTIAASESATRDPAWPIPLRSLRASREVRTGRERTARATG